MSRRFPVKKGDVFGKWTVVSEPYVNAIEELGLNGNTVRGRLRRGWSVERAFSKKEATDAK